jgi:hypothetical protein
MQFGEQLPLLGSHQSPPLLGIFVSLLGSLSLSCGIRAKSALLSGVGLAPVIAA